MRISKPLVILFTKVSCFFDSYKLQFNILRATENIPGEWFGFRAASGLRIAISADMRALNSFHILNK